MRRAFVALSVVAALSMGAAVGLAGNPRDEQVRLNAADTALARRAVLRRADLPGGWAAAPASGGEGSIRCAGYDPDFSRFTVTGKARSGFIRGTSGASVASSVQVFASAAQAAADFRLGTSPRLMDCVSAQLVRRLKAAGAADVRIASKRMSSTPRVGGQSVTYRLVLRISAGPASFAYHIDLVTFRVERAIGVVSFSSLGGSLENEAALARRVAGRLG